jgi:hypothetical protein
MAYGQMETWKIVYNLPVLDAGKVGVALVEAASRQDAMYTFYDQYRGQYSTVQSCTKLLG